MKNYSFEKFKSPGSRNSVKISIRESGVIGISQGALDKAGIKDEKWYAVLFFDKDQKVVGIRPTQESKEEGAAKIIYNAKERDGKMLISASISAKPFIAAYDIPNPKTKSFKAEWLPELNGGMLVADISGAFQPKTPMAKEESP